jgi:hypothetical protein
MTPAELVEAIEAEVATRHRTIDALQSAATALRTALGLPPGTQIAVTVCPPIEDVDPLGRPLTRSAPLGRLRRRPRKVRKTRASVRRGNAKAAKALRTKSGRQKVAPAGSLTDRILSTLAAFQAPMKKSAVVEAAKAREADVTAELKRLRTDGQIVSVGKGRGTRWSLPKFAHVLVAEDAV